MFTLIGEKILALARRLYPTGRVWWLSEGDFLSLHRALILSLQQVYADAMATLFTILPDNANFDETDALIWEQRLGLKIDSTVDLEDRKAAIMRKLQQPGRNPAKQHFEYIQSQLQAANFDVYIYENRFPAYPTGWETMTIQEFANLPDNQHGDFQHGDRQHGFQFSDVVVNHLEQELDSQFDIGANLRSTFFVGGPYPGSYAEVPLNRKDELRKLLLEFKPVQTVGYLLIDYTS
jgi:hypothetical protein